MIEQNYYDTIWGIALNKWTKEFNVGKKLTEFEPFEDHNLIPQYKLQEAKKETLFTKLKNIIKEWKY